MSTDVIDQLNDVPIYFICGTDDGLLSENQRAYKLLQDAGDQDLMFETFEGGHESNLENWKKMYAWIRNFSKNSTPVSVWSRLQRRPMQGLSGIIRIPSTLRRIYCIESGFSPMWS